MKRNILTIGCLFFSFISLSQQLSFNQESYSVGQHIVVSGAIGITGVENGIKGLSQPIDGNTNTIDLGVASTSGLYFVDFITIAGSDRLFLIGINPANSSVSTNTVYDLGSSRTVNQQQANIFKQMLKFFKEQPTAIKLKPIQNGLQKFCVNNSVNLVHNLAFCIAATQTGLPFVVTICSEMAKDNLEDLAMEIFKETFAQMSATGYIDQNQLNEILTNLDFYTNVGKMIEENCSGFFDYIADKIDDPNLKLAIKYQGQLCSSTVFIVKEYKKMP